jgi:hypothetical protein
MPAFQGRSPELIAVEGRYVEWKWDQTFNNDYITLREANGYQIVAFNKSGREISLRVTRDVIQKVVAMQHIAKGASKIVRRCTLPITSIRTVDLAVTELAVIAFPDGRATLLETALGVAVEDVVAATAAELVIPGHVPKMPL